MTIYEELKEKALSGNATQEDIDILGEWLETNDPQDWNGEYFDVEGYRLFPILRAIVDEETGEVDQYETVGYEFR